MPGTMEEHNMLSLVVESLILSIDKIDNPIVLANILLVPSGLCYQGFVVQRYVDL